MVKILNFGSLNLDNVYQVEKFVEPGETISSLNYNIFAGGKGLNQSIALAKAGVEVYHAGLIGKDGILLKDTCNKNNVNTEFIKITNNPTGHAVIQVDGHGENSIILYPGANFAMTKEFVDEVLDNFSRGDYIILQNEINLLDYIIDRAHSKGMVIILNPAPMNKRVFNYNLNYVNYLIVNETECFGLTGNKDIEKSLESLQSKFEDIVIIATLGENGSVYKDKNKTLKVKAYKVDVVDTTAAGDTFIGYFIACLSKWESVETSLELATKASAITVSRAGASTTIPTIEEVMNFKK